MSKPTKIVGSRSQFVSRAVLPFIGSQGKERLREELKREAFANAGRDVEMAAEWFPLEEDAATLPIVTAARRRTKGSRKSIA